VRQSAFQGGDSHGSNQDFHCRFPLIHRSSVRTMTQVLDIQFEYAAHHPLSRLLNSFSSSDLTLLPAHCRRSLPYRARQHNKADKTYPGPVCGNAQDVVVPAVPAWVAAHACGLRSLSLRLSWKYVQVLEAMIGFCWSKKSEHVCSQELTGHRAGHN